MKRYSISDVAELTKCTKRTVRYYVQLSLIPPIEKTGKSSYYTEDHINLIKIIKRFSVGISSIKQ